MNLPSHFNSPFMLGFDRMERIMDHLMKSAGDSYPPYNIEEIDERNMRISVAVAGFADKDLSVTCENSQLTISGKIEKTEETVEKNYVHKGIATRQFQRSFVLADGMKIKDAALENGLLHIDLERPEPEKKIEEIKIRKIEKK